MSYKFLNLQGLSRFLNKVKALIPTKTSDLTNDSGFLDTTGVQNYMENGGGYSQSYIDTALSGKADSSHTHTKSEITDFPTLATVATSGSYNDLSNTPTIPTVNNKTLTIQKNGTTVNTFTANSASDVTANITVPTAVSELTNDSGYLTSASSLDSSKLTGTIDIARLPAGALERLVTVQNQTARFALTTSDVQLGDTVKQLDTGVMYIVTDESKLSSADGYTEYTAGSATSVPWSGVTGKPSDYTPSSHTHGNVTNDGKLGTASKVVISDSNKLITTSSVTDTELGYLSGVTSSVQTQINTKANDSGVVHTTGNESISGTKSFNSDLNLNYASTDVDDIVDSIPGLGTVEDYVHISGAETISGVKTFSDGIVANVSGTATPLSHTHGNLTNDGKIGTTANKPVITGTNGVLTAGAFGTSANTFCEGNDSRLSDARTPVAHTHLTSDVTDLLNGNHTWTGDNTFSKAVGFTKVNVTTLYAQNSRVELGDSGLSGDSYNQIAFWDKNGDNVSYLRQTYSADGTNGFNLFVRNKFLNGVLDTAGTIDYAYFGLRLNPDKSKEAVFKASLRPYDSTYNYNLGDATYQWNNLYAKNYFYNGVAWGLDKANEWTETNTFTAVTGIKTTAFNIARSQIPDSNIAGRGLDFLDNNSAYWGSINPFWKSDGIFGHRWYLTQYNTNNVQGVWALSYYAKKDFSEISFIPDNNNTVNLGTSTNRWKTLNGVNPGALSLPLMGNAFATDVDITDWYIQDPDFPDDPTKKIIDDSVEHTVSSSFPGWLWIQFENVSGNFAYARQYNSGSNMSNERIANGLALEVFPRIHFVFPIFDSLKVRIRSKSANVRIFPCIGNV